MSTEIIDWLAGAACPCCGDTGTLALAETSLDVTGAIAVIAVCRTCTALINAGALWRGARPDALREQQTHDLDHAYAVPDDPEAIAQEIENHRYLSDFARRHCDDPQSALVADIGYGRGYGLMRLAGDFGKAVGVEFYHGGLQRIGARVGWPANLEIFDTIDQIPMGVDIAILWHVLEHIPGAPSFLRQIAGRMRPGGRLLCQVPLFRPAAIFEAHYTFFNRASIEVLLPRAGFELIDCQFDHENAFMTVIASTREARG